MIVIRVYAPTQNYDYDAVETFYDQQEEITKKTPKKDLLVVTGEWNAQVGSNAHIQWAETVGRFGLGDTNDRKLRLLEFASSHNLSCSHTRPQEEQLGIHPTIRELTKLTSSLCNRRSSPALT